MSNVFPLARPAAEHEIDPGLQRRVRLYSQALSWLFAGLAIVCTALLLAAIAAMLFYPGPLLRIGPTGMEIGGAHGSPGFVSVGSLPLVQRLIYVVVGVVRNAPKVAILATLWALFRLYGQGAVFTQANALRIRDVGLLLVIDAVLPFACHLVLSATGWEIDHRWAHLGSFQELVLGALVFVIAGVMRVAGQIDEERRAFV
jgi:hypothetical protein